MLSPGLLWNVAILEADGSPFAIDAATQLQLFDSRRLRRSRDAVHTRADPFLFVDGDWLYLFLEVQRVAQPGHIEAYRTRDLADFEPLGPILRQPTHLSYPQVFRSEAGVHMIPESRAAGEAALYSFADFPHGLTRTRTLLAGPYEDATIFHTEARWWLFATRDGALELWSAPDLASPFEPHPMNPLTDDPAAARCGGAVVAWAGGLYRLAQDGTQSYGGNLNAFRIDEIGPDRYRETLAFPSLFDRRAAWRSQGAHHLSVAQFNGRTILAVDGKQHDYRVNRLIALLFKLMPPMGSGRSS